MPNQCRPETIVGKCGRELTTTYRQQAKTCHPDKGGSKEGMQQLNSLRAKQKDECKVGTVPGTALVLAPPPAPSTDLVPSKRSTAIVPSKPEVSHRAPKKKKSKWGMSSMFRKAQSALTTKKTAKKKKLNTSVSRLSTKRMTSGMSTAGRSLSSGMSSVKSGLSSGMSSLRGFARRKWAGFHKSLGAFKDRIRTMEAMLRLAVIALAALMGTFLMIQWLVHLFANWMGTYLPILVQWYYIPVSLTAGILISKNVIKKKETKFMYMLAFVMSIVSVINMSIQISEMARSNSPTWQWIANAKTPDPPSSYSYVTQGTSAKAPFDHYPAKFGTGPEGVSDFPTCVIEDKYFADRTGNPVTVGGGHLWRPKNCPCLSNDDVDYLVDEKEDFSDADDEDRLEDYGGRAVFPPADKNECFLHPLYDGTIVLTKGMSRKNSGGKDNGLLVVTHNQHSFSDFDGKHTALLAIDIVILVLLLLNMILSGLILWVFKPNKNEDKTGPMDRSEPETRAQQMGKYTAYVLLGLYSITAFVGFLAYIEGYYLHLRLQLLLLIPTLAVGMMIEVPAKQARAGVDYFNHLKILLYIKNMGSRHKLKHEMTPNERDQLRRFRDNHVLDDKIRTMELRVPKYRELYGAASPAFNMSFVASVLTLIVGIYALVEHGVEVERYGDYLGKMSKSGVRYMPNSDTLLWVELPDSVAGNYLQGLYSYDLVVTLGTLLGGLLLTISCSWRLVQSVRNWRRLNSDFDLESREMGGGNHDALVAQLFGGMSEDQVDRIYSDASAPTGNTALAPLSFVTQVAKVV